MKKWLSLILVLALAACAVIIPASAEDTSGTDAVSSASVNTGSGRTQRNNPGAQMPGGQMPGGRGHGENRQHPNGAQGTQPAIPGGSVPDGTAVPAMPDGTAVPAMPDGTAVPAIPAEGDTGTLTAPPELPEAVQQPAEGTEAQESDGSAAKIGKDGKGSGKAGKKKAKESNAQPVTFELLLEKGVISQDVYDAIMAFIREYTGSDAVSIPVESTEYPNG